MYEEDTRLPIALNGPYQCEKCGQEYYMLYTELHPALGIQFQDTHHCQENNEPTHLTEA